MNGANGLPILDLDGVVEQINGEGYKIDASNGVITYSFFDGPVLTGLYNQQSGSKDGYGSQGLSPFTPAQEAAAREAIQMWDDLIPQTFVEKNGNGADILFANNLIAGQAYAFRPAYQQGYKFQSDVFVMDPEYNPSNKWFSPGGYGNTTLIHELGHSLGLSHPGGYNGDGTYGGDAEYAQDTTQFSIMSYFDQPNSGAFALNWNLFIAVRDANGNLLYRDPLITFAQTPQLHDIYVIQQAYGADPTTRAGDTTYGFGSNAGLWVYDFEQNPYPAISIYDAGGEDTIDASGFTVSQFIDLHEGSFSSIGGAPPTADELYAATVSVYFETYSETLGGGYLFQYLTSQAEIDDAFDFYSNYFAANLAQDTFFLSVGAVPGYEGTTPITGLLTSQYMNVSIAYGVTIENAIGGQARDGILGNEANNFLDGQAGDDVIFGYGGDDTIVGGLGADEMTGGAGSDTFVFDDPDAPGIVDIITDFSGEDFIDLSGLGDDSLGELAFIGDAGFSNTAGEVQYLNGMLSVDLDGDGAADVQIQLTNMPTLDEAQLILDAGT
ncbi:M10 family metallopeptidase [Sphingomicrobium nitratireducens]|uniref:M10 family metallopeptidase n=1 Tax=Sphingomicrobium nitratireducens TaxID=2964666 RepID=UPI0030B909E1